MAEPLKARRFYSPPSHDPIFFPDYYVEYIEPTGTKISEATLLAWVMKAQKLAYHFFVGSREWSEEENAVGLLFLLSLYTVYNT